MLERARMQQVSDLDVDRLRGLRGDDEVERLVRCGAQAQSRGDQGERRTPSLFFSEIGKHREQRLGGRVEAAVDVRVTVGAKDHVRRFVPSDREGSEVAWTEILDGVVQAVGVIAVVEVLEHHLPVPWEVGERETCGGRCVGQVVVLEVRLVGSEGRCQGLRSTVEVDEQEPEPLLDQQTGKTPLRLHEAGGPFHRRRAQQASVEPVHPLVVGAGEGAAVAAIVDDLHPSVLAYRRERMDCAVLGSGDDQSFAVDGRGEVITRLGDPVDSSDAQPLVIEQRVAFELEELVGGVTRRRQRARLVDVEDRVVEGHEQVGGQYGVIGHLETSLSAVGSFNKNFRILPTLVRGNSSTSEMSRGRFDFASRSLHQSISCSTVGGRAGSDATTKAIGTSSRTGSLAPTTAASSTAGWAARTCSTSTVETFSPATFKTSARRPSK